VYIINLLHFTQRCVYNIIHILYCLMLPKFLLSVFNITYFNIRCSSSWVIKDFL